MARWKPQKKCHLSDSIREVVSAAREFTGLLLHHKDSLHAFHDEVSSRLGIKAHRTY